LTAADPDHPIAVIVMSYGVRPTLAAAVRSVQQQDMRAEIVVVHSGESDVEAYLNAESVDVRVVRVRQRLFPGGARNAGINATTAPLIAFLADDCLAEPGWLRARLQAHAEGARAVASALLCHRPRNPIALAAHLSLFVRRMPQAQPTVALRYGASYARALFAQYGLFRDDMESGEDTEFHQRLADADKPVWRPDVRTVHQGAETLGAYLSGQFRRGRRMSAAWAAIGGDDRLGVARNAIERTALIIREGMDVVEPENRLAAWLAIPLIVLGNAVYALGAWGWGGKGDLDAH
jgi:glycosyltransferase involved in cell wall biosynthesis